MINRKNKDIKNNFESVKSLFSPQLFPLMSPFVPFLLCPVRPPQITYVLNVFWTSFMDSSGQKTPVSNRKKMKFSIKDLFCKCDRIRSFLQIWSHLLKKSLKENFIFCAVLSLVAIDKGCTYFYINY